VSTQLARWLSPLFLLAFGCTDPASAPGPILARATQALRFEESLQCVAAYAERGACDWAHWSEMYEACEIFDDAHLDDGTLMDEVKAGTCTWAGWPALYDRLMQARGPASDAPAPRGGETLTDALNCVASYVHRGACDWAHWSEMYEVCGTHRFDRLDDGFLLELNKAGECTWESWPAIFEHAMGPAPLAVRAPEPAIESLDDALACLADYAERGACDWAHWSEMYERCQTFAYPALDDGYLIAEVKAGACTAERWPEIREHVAPSMLVAGGTIITDYAPPCTHDDDLEIAPVAASVDSFEAAVFCVAGYASRGECDWAHWSEMYETCKTYEYAALDDGVLLDHVKEGECTWETWAEIYQNLPGVPASEVGSLPRFDASLRSRALLLASTQRVNWTAIQGYVARAQSLPGSDSVLLQQLGAGWGEVGRFTPLREAFDSMRGHGAQLSTLLPDATSLAADLQDYALATTDTYAPLSELIARLRASRTDSEAEQLFQARVATLAGEVLVREQHAGTLEDRAHDLATAVEGDQARLESVRSSYQGAESQGDRGRLTAAHVRLAQLAHALAAAHVDLRYNLDMVAGTAAYAWIWPWGTIAAASVAGVHGQRATDARNRISDLTNQITSEAGVARDMARRLHSLDRAIDSADQVGGSIAGVRPELGKLREHWQEARNDLEKLTKIVGTDLKKGTPITRRVLLELALSKWQQVHARASAYLAP
jgi:hypothetical protein